MSCKNYCTNSVSIFTLAQTTLVMVLLLLWIAAWNPRHHNVMLMQEI